MIETFFLDWPLSFGVGVLFGWAGTARAAPSLRSRAFAIGFAYQQLGVLSIALALYAVQPDWMWMYWVEARALPIVVVVLAFAIYEVCFVAGFALGGALGGALDRRAVPATLVTLAVALTTAQWLARHRLTHFGTTHQYQSNVAKTALAFRPFHLAPPMAVVLVSGGLSLVVLGALAVHVRRSPAPS